MNVTQDMGSSHKLLVRTRVMLERAELLGEATKPSPPTRASLPSFHLIPEGSQRKKLISFLDKPRTIVAQRVYAILLDMVGLEMVGL